MEAVLFLNIDGRHFKVNTSTLQGIYHGQKDNNLLLIIGAIFAIKRGTTFGLFYLCLCF